MAIKKTDDVYYFAIANAIRTKNGEETLYRPHEMATAIGAIPTGGSASGLPIEIDNETDMLAVLNDSSNEGKYYLYTNHFSYPILVKTSFTCDTVHYY